MKRLRMSLLTITLLLGACASSGKLREAELARLVDWLPGTYSNHAQVEEDMKRPDVDVHAPVDMVIMAVQAQLIGEQLFFVQQNDAMNPRRIIGQWLWGFEKSGDEKVIVQTVYTFKEEDRWAAGHQRSDIFKSLMPDDLSATGGCEVLWVFNGTEFAGSDDVHKCREHSEEAGANVALERKFELTADVLKISERGFGADGTLKAGRRDDPFFVFHKTGAAK